MQDLLTSLLGSMHDPLVLVGEEGGTLPANPAAISLLEQLTDSREGAARLVRDGASLNAPGQQPGEISGVHLETGAGTGVAVSCTRLEAGPEELASLAQSAGAETGAERLALCLLRPWTHGRGPALTTHAASLPEQNPNPVMRADFSGIVQYLNPAARFLLEVHGGGLGQQVPGILRPVFEQAVHDGMSREIEIDAGASTYSLTVAPIPVESQVNIYGVDITRRVRMERKLREIAMEDELTRLPNRSTFLDTLRHALDTHREEQKVLAVLFIDISRFARINDTYGHKIGDELLVCIAERLRASIRVGDTLARVGGDQFCVLQEQLGSITEMVVTARGILELFDRPLQVHSHDLQVSVSIGISLNTKSHVRTEDILREAETAMRRARRMGRGRFAVFDETMNERIERSLQLETKMRRGMDSDAFVMYYQPKVNADDSTVVGFESLVRWTDSEEGMISPGEFIPVAEETGLIASLGDWIIEAVCRDLRGWLDAGIDIPPVAVNCSAIQLQQKEFVEQVRGCLERYSLEPVLFQIEITESCLIEDLEAVIEKLQQLSDMGIKIFMDDFGTGFSSLQYLRRLPIHYLKVDQSFVADMLEDKGDRTITSTIIAMARELGLKVIAEGVENRKQVYSLMAMGCGEIQGFYYSAALPPDQVPAYVAENSGKDKD